MNTLYAWCRFGDGKEVRNSDDSASSNTNTYTAGFQMHNISLELIVLIVRE